MNTAQKHQLAIARKTLRMTPAGARIMGGMDFPSAYEFVFKTPLRERLYYLVSEYPNPAGINWELNTYGWDNPADLLAQL